MRFHQTAMQGVILIENDPVRDERGSFVRTFCAREMAAHGINPSLAQTSLSFNTKRGTLRGMHFQRYPATEDKLVGCVRGAIFDVMVDVRFGSPTFGHWLGYELSDVNHCQLFAPKGIAHGFQALVDHSVVTYQIAQFYEAEKTAGVRFNDPAIGIRWPLPPTVVSERDVNLPFLAQLDPSILMPFRQQSDQ